MLLYRSCKYVYLLLIILLVSACTSSGFIRNSPIDQVGKDNSYSLRDFNRSLSRPNNSIMLAFSGGGTRAAALSYGVLQELNETHVTDTHTNSTINTYPLLNDVGLISSVSGGSFTAAYYGLYGEKIFTDFEPVFLKKNVQRTLINFLLSPLNWFNKINRTENAIRYYDKTVFNNATFSDMLRPNAPMVLINATDLTQGTRFSFMQEYFDLLCSDLSDFSVSRAVTASSAVPLLFTPVVVKNHSDCVNGLPQWLKNAKAREKDDPELALITSSLEGYFNKEKNPFSHFIDGGISDNLGLRSIFDIARISGGTGELLKGFDIDLASRFVVISIDASTIPETSIGKDQLPPDFGETLNKVTDIQLHRYNTTTNSVMSQSLKELEATTSKTNPVETYFIKLSFADIKDDELKAFINQVPTSFNLEDQQVDKVIQAGRYLLKENSEFKRLLRDIAATNNK